MTDGTSDLQLVRRALAKDRGARDTLMARLGCVESILTALNRRSGNPLAPTDLDDLVQDTLVAVWERVASFEGRAALETWVYRFCFLGFLGRCRQVERNRKTIVPLETLTKVPAAVAGTLSLNQILRQLEDLPDAEAQVITLKHLDGLTFAEISDVMGVSASTCKSHYYRGLETLRRRQARAQEEHS